jgi:iron-sulfur cluster insertion protein
MISITDQAKVKIKTLLANELDEHLIFRISVSSGGCSGFQYHFELDDKQDDDDSIFEDDGIAVVVDPASMDLIDGCTLDYVEDLAEARFVIKNPNAAASCGCGNSFTI